MNVINGHLVCLPIYMMQFVLLLLPTFADAQSSLGRIEMSTLKHIHTYPSDANVLICIHTPNPSALHVWNQ